MIFETVSQSGAVAAVLILKFDSIHSGFAARCEAGLCPAVQLQRLMGYAPGSGFAPTLWAKGRTRGGDVGRVLRFVLYLLVSSGCVGQAGRTPSKPGPELPMKCEVAL